MGSYRTLSSEGGFPKSTSPNDDGSHGAEIEYLTGRTPSKDVGRQSTERPDFSRKRIPNTLCAISVISFLLGGLCIYSLSVVCHGLDSLLNPKRRTQIDPWWATPQIAFFLAAWSFFHWAEFAVTAGWNLEKCSVDCKKLFVTIAYNGLTRYVQLSSLTMVLCIISRMEQR